MNPDHSNLRVSAIAPDVERRLARHRFEAALLSRRGNDQEQSGAGEAFEEEASDGSASIAGVLHPNALAAFARSLQELRALNQGEGTAAALMGDIVKTIREGRHLPSDQWRLKLRVRDEVLQRTEIEIAAKGGRFSVVLRTCNDTAFEQIGRTLDSLNRALISTGQVSSKVAVFLVSSEEIP